MVQLFSEMELCDSKFRNIDLMIHKVGKIHSNVINISCMIVFRVS